jgi:type I restriction-modification system DNA methylase subunit
MPAPNAIKSLVERFERNHEQYHSSKYNETQARQEFINPLFAALGWDIDNEQGFAEQYKEVIHEDTLEIEGASKAPDYAFRIGGTRKFFVEAKKPSVKLETDIHPAYQLRRYAWSAKLPLSLLTDFEEFAIYDCRVKPDKNDKASVGRVALYSHKDYVEKWDEIAAIFSKDAIQKGSFDKYAEGIKGKKGTAEVDDAFLEEIERWRDMLARNIAIRNEKLSVRELNFAVQATIDRIVFLRICEDRGVERDEQLKAIAEEGEIYSGLCRLFQQADARYNSGLFHFAKEKDESSAADSLTLGLKIDDKVLQDILQNLYYPDSPYVFREIPSDILGQVYERFLGKVIRLTAGHQAKVEEKPEVRKAGGVYYTPTYIVDYIVQNTVGKLLEGKSPKDVTRLKILDPACGSGTFPLGAYQYLLDWHLKWYTDHEPEKWASGKDPAIYQAPSGSLSHLPQIPPGFGGGRVGAAGWRLTTSKKKEILLNNIHGVDIDPQAVEVTKLSLLLKVLEGESQETIGSQLGMFKERVLPDLGRNIKCGNSLIGSDYYQDRQLTMLIDDEERYRVNAFDWKTEFSQVFIQGGFDVVIGNPPYGAELSSQDIEYLHRIYSVAEYQLDTYPLFIEKALQFTKQSEYCGFIIPSAWVASKFDKNLRQLILSKTIIQYLVITAKKTFAEATVETLILIFKNGFMSKNTFQIERWDKDQKEKYQFVQDDISKQEDLVFPVYANPAEISLISKMRVEKNVLSEYASAVWGVKIYQKGKGKPVQKGYESEQKVFHSSQKIKDTHKPLIGGSAIRRYELDWKGEYVDYGQWLAEPRTPEWFSGSRILVREVTAEGVIQATITEDDYVFSNSVDGLKLKNNELDLRFILGLLNSQLISFYHLNTSANAFKGAFPKLLIKDLLNIPLPIMSADKARHDKMVSLVERMLELHKQSPKTPQEQEMVKREIESTDTEIDELVYELSEEVPKYGDVR